MSGLKICYSHKDKNISRILTLFRTTPKRLTYHQSPLTSWTLDPKHKKNVQNWMSQSRRSILMTRNFSKICTKFFIKKDDSKCSNYKLSVNDYAESRYLALFRPMISLKNWRYLVNQLDEIVTENKIYSCHWGLFYRRKKTVLTHLIVKIVSIEVKTRGIVKAV